MEVPVEAEGVEEREIDVAQEVEEDEKIAERPSLATFLGLSFAIFIGFLPKSSQTFISTLQLQNRTLSLKLIQAEEQLKQMKTRRAEDSKANAKVVEIFAAYRSNWQLEEKRLLKQNETLAEEIVRLKKRIEEMEKNAAEFRVWFEKVQGEEEFEVSENVRADNDVAEENGEIAEDLSSRIERIRVSRGGIDEFSENGGAFFGDPIITTGSEFCFWERNGGESLLNGQTVLNRDFLPSPSEIWTERSGKWQDSQYEPLESMYNMKHYVARRESPWKVDGESTGVSSKLKLLEQELLNLERIGQVELAKVPSLMRKQAKRYQGLAGKIDDLCKRMQASDPSEPTISSEFRTQRQTEFLLETFRLQQRAIETGQKLTALHGEIVRSRLRDEVGGQAKVKTRRSLDSIKNNLREVQRNLEIWLARIMGDLEGLLARDGMSRARDYCFSRYPYL